MRKDTTTIPLGGMFIHNQFQIGQVVFLKTDLDQYPRIVIGIRIRDSLLMYDLVSSTEESCHYSMEIQGNEGLLEIMKKQSNDN